MGIKESRLLILVCLSLGATLSGASFGPEMTLNYNPLQSARAGMHLHTAPKSVRFDQQAQISALHTSLVSAALEFSAIDTETRTDSSMDMLETSLTNLAQLESGNPMSNLFPQDPGAQDLLNLISMVLPSQEMVAEIARMVDPLEPNRPSVGSGNPSFPAASILALALSQRS